MTMAQATQNLMTQLTNILTTGSIYTRCRELDSFMSQCPLDDLRILFPGIVDNIFGVGSYTGWGLRNLNKTQNSREAEIVLKFLGSNGPLITTAYRLMDDQHLRYSFPFSCLPAKLAKEILNGNIPPFFTNKIPILTNNMSQKTISENLKLNPFEYILFHYTYLNNAHHPDTSNYLIGWGSGLDSVYTNLLEDYLDYFFPCNGGGVPRIDQNILRGPDPSFISNTTTSNSSSNPSSLFTPSTSELNRPTLFMQSVFQEQLSGRSREAAFHSSHIFTQKEIWRTEAFFNILMEMWMNIEDTDSPYSIQLDTFLPSVDLIKCIRMLVRHTHYFINCVSRTAQHPMDEIRRNCYPVFQKKLYVFIRHLFNKWPVDNSFRIVYETWLSYIQPWRYVNYERSRQKEREDTNVDNRYLPFISENLLFYTKFLQMIFQRFVRGDVNACKNALMIYRTMKVFCVNVHLKNSISAIERDIIQSGSFSPPLPASSNVFNNSFSKSSQNQSIGFDQQYSSTHKISHLRQLMRDLESPDYIYKPLFSEETRILVGHILMLIARSKESISQLIVEEEILVKPKGWQDWLFGYEHGASNLEGNSIVEKKKTMNYLDAVRMNLCYFFEIVDDKDEQQRLLNGSEMPEILNRSWRHNTIDFSRSLNGDNDQIFVKNSGINKSKSFSRHGNGDGSNENENEALTPLGNPDDELFRSDEIPCAVRFLRTLSDFINKKYGTQIERTYHLNNARGKLFRLIFAKPLTYEVLEKPEFGVQIRKSMYLPPRVKLRFFGSKVFILSFLLFLFLFIFLLIL